MAIPLEGSKKIVGITGPCGTEEVTVTGGKLDVNAVFAPPAPGTSISCFTYIVVPAAAVGLALPAIPAGTLRATYQNVSPAAGRLRIRDAAAAPPAGPELALGQAVTFGGFGGSLPIVTPVVADGDPFVPTHLSIYVELP